MYIPGPFFYLYRAGFWYVCWERSEGWSIGWNRD